MLSDGLSGYLKKRLPEKPLFDNGMQAHIYITASGVGIGADFVRADDEFLRVFFADAGHGNGQIDVEAERAVRFLPDTHAYCGFGCGGVDIELLFDQAHRAVEAGGVAHGEKLFGVGALLAAFVLEGYQVKTDRAVINLSASVASAGGCG